jgi:hypothetical protein
MTTTALFWFLCVFWCAEPWALLEPDVSPESDGTRKQESVGRSRFRQ